MIVAAILFAAAMAQAPSAPGDCASAMSRGTTAATAQICLAETELGRAQTQGKESPERKRHLETAAALYKKAFGLPADDEIKTVIIERLLLLFDAPMLDDESEMFAAFRDLISLRPHESAPLLRLAKYQESRGAVDAAEETLLSARRLQPGDIEPLRMLAQFYARRAGAMHASAVKQDEREQTPPGTPDKDGAYR